MGFLVAKGRSWSPGFSSGGRSRGVASRGMTRVASGWEKKAGIGNVGSGGVDLREKKSSGHNTLYDKKTGELKDSDFNKRSYSGRNTDYFNAKGFNSNKPKTNTIEAMRPPERTTGNLRYMASGRSLGSSSGFARTGGSSWQGTGTSSRVFGGSSSTAKGSQQRNVASNSIRRTGARSWGTV